MARQASPQPACSQPLRLHQLPVEVLQAVAALVDYQGAWNTSRANTLTAARARLAAVCRAWRAALASPSPAWHQVDLSPACLVPCARHLALVPWLQARAPAIRLADLAYSNEVQYEGVLTVVGAGLSSLRFRPYIMAAHMRQNTIDGIILFCPRLKTLALDRTPPSADLRQLSRLTQLEDLSLAFTTPPSASVPTVPIATELCELTALTRLSYCAGCLRELPSAISRLSRLACLEVVRAVSLQPCASLVALTALTRLSFVRTSFAVAAAWPSLRALTALRSVGVHDCHSTGQLAASLATLPGLRDLTASGTGDYHDFAVLPQLAGVTALTALCYTSFAAKEVPAGVLQLTRLQYLRLAENELSELPEAISVLCNLHTLDVCGNQWPGEPGEPDTPQSEGNLRLPHALGALSRLTERALGDNRLSGGDALLQIRRLARLSELYLYNVLPVDVQTSLAIVQLVRCLERQGRYHIIQWGSRA